MPENQRMDILKEQISFLEARLTRYEELLHGSVLNRILFGGGRRAKLSIAEVLIGLIILLYTLFRVTPGAIFFVIIALSVFMIFFSSVQLNLIRKKNGPEKYQKMINSLTLEKASMEKEVARIKENRPRS